MSRLIDRLAEKLREIARDEYVSFVTSDEAFELLKEYDAFREQEDREALLTNTELVDDPEDEASDYTALSPEYKKTADGFVIPVYHPLQSLPVEDKESNQWGDWFEPVKDEHAKEE